MDEDIERLVLSVRADTQGFARDVGEMRAALEGGLGAGAEQAGRRIEAALGRAIRTGKFGFDDLKRVALAALAEIAAGAVQDGLGAIFGGGGGGGSGSGLGGIANGLIGAVLGLPGRAGGGPVAPGRGYIVGERGPELFVPGNAGRIEPGVTPRGGRDVRIAITINAPAGSEPRALTRSSRQIARAVRGVLDAAGD